MVLKQKGKPEKGKKPVRGGPRQFTDSREFPDGPVEGDNEIYGQSGSEEEEEEDSEIEQPTVVTNSTGNKPRPAAPSTTGGSSSNSAPKSGEMSRRDREAMQKEQARQHYLKMKEKEDGARLAVIRKQREEAAAQHAEALKAKEALKRR